MNRLKADVRPDVLDGTRSASCSDACGPGHAIRLALVACPANTPTEHLEATPAGDAATPCPVPASISARCASAALPTRSTVALPSGVTSIRTTRRSFAGEVRLTHPRCTIVEMEFDIVGRLTPCSSASSVSVRGWAPRTVSSAEVGGRRHLAGGAQFGGDRSHDERDDLQDSRPCRGYGIVCPTGS